MFFSSPPRNLKPELLDLDEAPFDEVQDSLEDVRLVNRYLGGYRAVSYTHLRAHETPEHLVCRLLLEKKKQKKKKQQ